MKIEHLADGLPVYRAAGWGGTDVVHFATTRLGGVSRAPFDALNLGGRVGDDPAAVDANQRRLCTALGIPRQHLVTAEQIHGATVAVVPAAVADGAAAPPPPVPAVDALATATPGLCLLVTVADCVPVYVAHPAGTAVGIAHAGWQGTLAGIAARLVGRLERDLGCVAGELEALIGPSIGPEDYEVGPEVVEQFRDRWADRSTAWLCHSGDGRTRLDLWRANADQLIAAGLRPASVRVAGVSTPADHRHCFSHRRDGARTGRMGAGILIRRPVGAPPRRIGSAP